MSNMYIRSQDREKLYRLGGNYACVEYGSVTKRAKKGQEPKETHRIFISDGVLEEIGTYETKERCLEIIDEIQKVSVSYLYSAGSPGFLKGAPAFPPFAAEIPRIGNYFKMLNGYSPTFTSFSGGVYEMDLTRTAVNNFATHCSKLKPEIEGSALKTLEKTLQHKPNYFMDTTKFIKRLATYVAVEHTAFIIPISCVYRAAGSGAWK